MTAIRSEPPVDTTALEADLRQRVDGESCSTSSTGGWHGTGSSSDAARPRTATARSGGMIGNNSCGATAQRYGKTVDNVRRLEILTYDGLRCWVGATSEEELAEIITEGGPRADLYRRLARLRDHYGDAVRERFPDIASAADAVPDLLAHGEPLRVEALDDRLVQFMRAEKMHVRSTELLPDGGGWLLVQCAGRDTEDAERQAEALVKAVGRDPRDHDVLLASFAVSAAEPRSNRQARDDAPCTSPNCSPSPSTTPIATRGPSRLDLLRPGWVAH